MLDNIIWNFSKNEEPLTDNSESPKAKNSINAGCSICGRLGHLEQACAASIQIFEWPYPAKGQVYLCGDFSFWQKWHPMHSPDKDHPHTWLQLNLAPSKYQYKFLVDGKWVYDERQPIVPDGKGGFNNTIEVAPARFEESDEDDEEPNNPKEYSVVIQKNNLTGKIPMKTVRVSFPFDANWVSLKGSWDNWENEIPLKKIKNNITGHYEFYVRLRVPAGSYEFKFLVNGQWMIDPTRKKTKNALGEENNILEVKIKALSPTGKKNSVEKEKVYQWERLLLDYQLPADFKHLMQGHSISVIGEEVYVFGGMRNKDFTNSMYMLDLSTSEITCVDQNGPVPCRRAFHGAIVFYSKIIIYGGFNEKSVLSDYHVFNTVNKTWLESPTLGGDQPHPRERFSLVSYHEKNLILFGGYYCSEDLEVEEHYNDAYALHLGSLEWHKLECEGETPKPRFGHTASVIDKSMYVFGGVSRANSSCQNFNDLYALKFRNKESNAEWKKLEPKGQPPEPRHGHTAVVVKTNILILAGRGNMNKMFGGLHILDTQKLEWIHPQVTGDIPQPRYYHACQLLSNQTDILLLGGYKKDFHQTRYFKLSLVDKEDDSQEDDETEKPSITNKF